MKVLKLTGKEWTSDAWNGDIWLDPNETDNPETPSHSESTLPIKVACLPVSETSLPQLESPVITPSETDGLKEDAQSLQYLPQPTLVPIITRVKSHKVLGEQVHAGGNNLYTRRTVKLCLYVSEESWETCRSVF